MIPARFISGERILKFQQGYFVSGWFDFSLPYCSLKLTGSRLGQLNGDLRLLVDSAESIPGSNGTRLRFFNGKAFVTELECFAPSYKPTVKDALDALGLLVTLNHTGSSDVQNQCPAQTID